MKRELTATAYIVHQDKVLLVKHKKIGQWIAVGGHVDENETPCEALVREIKEETGLEVEFTHLIEKIPDNEQMVYLPKPNHIQLEDIPSQAEGELHQHVDFMYFVKAKNANLSLTQENPLMQWFSSEELDELETWADVKHWAKKAIEEAKPSESK